MLRFESLSKSFVIRGYRKLVIDNLDMVLPTGKSLALMGRNGAGKSTLLQLIAGTLRPDRGRVVHEGSVSWPVGFGGSFHRDLTGAQNVRF
ncbi:MAG: ATP-binding cassette domain-containing protein, partial [Paracoccaceae bacterium]